MSDEEKNCEYEIYSSEVFTNSKKSWLFERKRVNPNSKA